MKKQTAEIIGHSDKRWSSFASVMVNQFPTLREPVNDETIPGQMAQREQSLLLKDTSERETMRMRINELEIKNKGLENTNKGHVESHLVLTKRFNTALAQRDERVDVEQYKRLLEKHDSMKRKFASEKMQLEEHVGRLNNRLQNKLPTKTPTDSPSCTKVGQPSAKRLRPGEANAEPRTKKLSSVKN
jgi:hypothetical protein